jgi:hypothetical protein
MSKRVKPWREKDRRHLKKVHKRKPIKRSMLEELATKEAELEPHHNFTTRE